MDLGGDDVYPDSTSESAFLGGACDLWIVRDGWYSFEGEDFSLKSF